MLSIWHGELVPPPPAPPRTKAEIVAEVAARHGVSVAEIRGQELKRYAAWPRQAAMWALRSELRPDGVPRFSLPAIGAYLGGRDHTTILHGIRAHEARMKAGEE